MKRKTGIINKKGQKTETMKAISFQVFIKVKHNPIE